MTKNRDPLSRSNGDHNSPVGELVSVELERLRCLIDSGFNARVIMRPVRDSRGHICDFVLLEVNEAACRYNRLPREQMQGRRVLELFPNTKASGLFDMFCRALETGQMLELRNFSYAHDLHGETRHLEIRAVPTGGDVVSTWRDLPQPAPGPGQEPQSGGDSAGPERPVVLERRKARSLRLEAEAQVREFQSLAQSLLLKGEEQQQVISRELHDNIAQVLAAATARIGLAKDEPIPAWLRQELVDLRDQLRAALDDVRTLARELRPALLDHLGFAAALEKHAATFRARTGIALESRLEPDAVGCLPPEGLTHLFRLAQEALQNIEEHSRAANVWIELARRDGALHLEIGDDGCAFTPERVVEAQRDGHLGLLGMRERAELLGARFSLEASPGRGTVIRVAIPPRDNTLTLHP